MIRFTATELDHAYVDWICTCGPAALAAICGLTLDEVRPHFNPAFPGYTTPTRMYQALRNTGVKWRAAVGPVGSPLTTWPRWGLARIQWHGPWTALGASQRWAYMHTHWVGVSRLMHLDGSIAEPDAVCIWDVNAMDLGQGWAPLRWWETQTVPQLTREIPRASGGWHITHAIEVER